MLFSQSTFAAGSEVGTNGSFIFDGATIYVTDGRFVDDRRGASSTGISGYINLDGTYTLDSQAFADALHIPISGKATDRLAFQGYSIVGQAPVVVHQTTSAVTGTTPGGALADPNIFYGDNGQGYSRTPTAGSFVGSNGITYTEAQVKAWYAAPHPNGLTCLNNKPCTNGQIYGADIEYVSSHGMKSPDLYKFRYLAGQSDFQNGGIYTDPKEYDAYAPYLRAEVSAGRMSTAMSFQEWRAKQSGAYLASLQISGKTTEQSATQSNSITSNPASFSQVSLKHPLGTPATLSNLYTIPQNFDYSGGSGIYTPQGTELSKQSFADFFNSNPTNEEVYTYGLNLGLNQYQMSNALAQWLGKTYYGSITVPDAAATIGGSAGGAGRTDSIYVTSGTGAWGSGACGGRGWGGANWSVTDGFGGYGACKTLANITNNTTTSNTAVVSTTSPNANLVTTQTPLSDAESDSNSCLVITTPLSYQAKDSTTNGFVTKLQDFLHATSYLPSLSTGFFGAGTFKAVKAFQGANGISQTGSVGPNTRAKIKEISCAMQGAPLTDNDVTLSDNITFSNLPAGCTSSTTFSPTTGGRCVSASLPEGCTSNTTFSPVTGVRCVAQ